MNPTETLLLTLLDCAIHEKQPPEGCARGADCWQALADLARSHHIEALLLDAALAVPGENAPARELIDQWQAAAMNTMMSQGALAIQASMLTQTLDEAGVKAVMLKGMALKALYPQPDLRTMSDLDLLVAPAQQEAAHAAMEAAGYTVVEREPGVDVMRAPEGLRVELHSQLFDKTEEGFLSKLDEAVLFPIESAVREEVYCGEAFPPQEHLAFLLLHMAKHLITTGFGLRQLADYSLFIEKRGSEDRFHRAARADEGALAGRHDGRADGRVPPVSVAAGRPVEREGSARDDGRAARRYPRRGRFRQKLEGAHAQRRGGLSQLRGGGRGRGGCAARCSLRRGAEGAVSVRAQASVAAAGRMGAPPL